MCKGNASTRPLGTVTLEATLAATLHRRRQQSTLRALTTNSAESIDFSSNDFLSLAHSSELRAAFLKELNAESKLFPLGSGGSRLLDGNSIYAESLERDIAAFHGAPVGLLCNSGFDANVGLFSCLPQPGDIVLYDEYIHASVHDGMKVSRAAKCVSFAHSCVSSFRNVLQMLITEDSAVLHGEKNVFVALEAIYSMDGDVAPLREIADIVDELLPAGNGHLIVDEAHSTGVLGANGRGLVCNLGLEDRVLIRLHTFGKALACNGAIILCTPTIRQYLVNYARPLIYTTFLSFPALAAIRASYTLLISSRTTSLQRSLFALISHLHSLLHELTRTTNSQSLLRVSDDCPPSPIFSILTSEPRSLALWCQKAGFVVRAIVPPTVPAGAERIRVCLHAGNSVEEVERLVARIGEWVGVQRAAKL